MNAEEAKRQGFHVELLNPAKPGISLGLDGLEEFIRQEIARSQPDYKELTEAVRSIVVADNETLIEAIRSISVGGGDSDKLQVMSEAFDALHTALEGLTFETPNVAVTIEAPNRRIIVSADIEHEWDRNVPVLKKLTFNYGEE